MTEQTDFNDGTAGIIAAAVEVHKTLGPGFQEVIYQRALFYEMKLREMDFQREVEIEIFYRGRKIGTRRVDFMVEECLVEIKAKMELEDCAYPQSSTTERRV